MLDVAPRSEHGRFLPREVVVDGVTHRYQVFLPAATAAGKKPPVILFLHGSGERGDDGTKPTLVGIGPHIRVHQDSFPAIVVFPQAPDGSEWSDNLELVDATLDVAMREFHGDPRRIYLTGLSMGGYGVWDVALRAPDRFAALAPVCGGVRAPRAGTRRACGSLRTHARGRRRSARCAGGASPAPPPGPVPGPRPPGRHGGRGPMSSPGAPRPGARPSRSPYAASSTTECA